MKKARIIGVDLGGTNLRAAIVQEGAAGKIGSRPLAAQQDKEEVLAQIFDSINRFFDKDVAAIGIGVPGLVDPVSKTVYDVVNVPALNGLHLQSILERRYGVPVKAENDANCFALGEFHSGNRQHAGSLIGLAIGTGLGAGIVLDGKLYSGRHGGAGEFGMMKYLDRNIEYYVSGRFFEHVFGVAGETAYAEAIAGNVKAVGMYETFGRHLGEAIKMILYALDISCIVIGGSLRAAFPLYEKSMWETVNSFEYARALANLEITPSVLDNGNILGAAALHF
ncbi:ROK family protein [Chitinophaga sp. YIM B06452]|uniref:ROK family protein n=1 Tax=Chitinophaga sp. YIM B06452 TaxID=3082158 RepID=UPI0031FF1E14